MCLKSFKPHGFITLFSWFWKERDRKQPLYSGKEALRRFFPHLDIDTPTPITCAMKKVTKHKWLVLSHGANTSTHTPTKYEQSQPFSPSTCYLWANDWVPASFKSDRWGVNSACHFVALRPSPTCLNFWILGFLTGIMEVLKPVLQNFEEGMLKIEEKNISKAPGTWYIANI